MKNTRFYYSIKIIRPSTCIDKLGLHINIIINKW